MYRIKSWLFASFVSVVILLFSSHSFAIPGQDDDRNDVPFPRAMVGYTIACERSLSDHFQKNENWSRYISRQDCEEGELPISIKLIRSKLIEAGVAPDFPEVKLPRYFEVEGNIEFPVYLPGNSSRKLGTYKIKEILDYKVEVEGLDEPQRHVVIRAQSPNGVDWLYLNLVEIEEGVFQGMIKVDGYPNAESSIFKNSEAPVHYVMLVGAEEKGDE